MIPLCNDSERQTTREISHQPHFTQLQANRDDTDAEGLRNDQRKEQP